jgi:hypothetical protein
LSLASKTPQANASPHRIRLLPLVFFLGGILLLIFGVAMLGASWFVREPPLPDGLAWQPPLEQVRMQDLIPSTALLPLADVSGADALNAALDGGHWENVFALVAYDASLSDPTRIGALLQLGTRYAAAGNSNRAAWCYLYASRIATISPLLSDAVREDTFLQVGAGLRAIEADGAARLAIDQAYLVAQYSPVLQRDQSTRRLNQVANAYAALGAETLATEARDKANEPVAIASDNAGLLPREPFVIPEGELSPAAEVNRAQQARRAAAQQLIDDVKDKPPRRAADWPSDSLTQLRDALVKEDQARRLYYDQQMAQVKEPTIQIALLRDKVNWIGLKIRIARGAFGVDLVPAWRNGAAELADEWSDAWGALFNAYAAQASAIPNAQAVHQATEDVLRQELLAQRWGWYKGKSESELRASLSDVTGQLRQDAIPSLRLDALALGGKTTDLLVPDELFGQNERALPH